MDSDPYQQMRTVMAAPRLARAIAIGSRFCARAAAMLERLGLAGVTPSAAVDRQLLPLVQSHPPLVRLLREYGVLL
jgi:hypothetical protein